MFGYLVGNEIPTTMVRWLGVRRVTQFLEHLINVARAVDPAALYSYASYPPTEYLLPQNVDFCTFNVYLHAPARFRELPPAPAKPRRRQAVHHGRVRHGHDPPRRGGTVAKCCRWHVESVVRCGLAGTVLYAWTDEWFTGGMDITDWAFGLVTRERVPEARVPRDETKAGAGATTNSSRAGCGCPPTRR